MPRSNHAVLAALDTETVRTHAHLPEDSSGASPFASSNSNDRSDEL